MAVYAVTYDSKSSYITNGKRYRVERDDGRGLFNIRSNRGTMLTCLWEGCAHLGTRGNWTRIEEEEQVTLLPGDYVSTEGMTEDQYHAVARAFMAAGAAGGEYPNYSFADEEISCPRWSFGNRREALFHGLSGCFDGRHLTPAQVIGAVNAGNQQEKGNMEHKAGDRFVATADSRFFSEGSTVRFTGEYGCFGNPKMELVSGECSLNNGPGGTPGAIETFDRFEKIKQEEGSRAQYRAVRSPFFSDGSIVEVREYDTDGSSLFRLVSGECKYNNADGMPGAWCSFSNMEPINMSDTLTQTLLDAAEHDEKARHHAAEHDRLMQHALDMLPDGWRLVKSEDMMETLSVDANPFIKGMAEDMTDPANWREGDVLICVDDANVHWVTKGKTYVMHGRDEDKWPVITDDDGDKLGLKPARFRLHHRPT